MAHLELSIPWHSLTKHRAKELRAPSGPFSVSRIGDVKLTGSQDMVPNWTLN
ncbi:hypothetical protein Scep_004491 [Stephania cephalantha]|uniref:Uncharacterized protein n=1 Tax=Stephania cephalantha TaxID=152367 RepID=A0AAP0KSJ8_9MAGN